MRVIAIKKMSAGNDTVGEMWVETEIFDAETTLKEVMLWVGESKDVVLSVPCKDWQDYRNRPDQPF